MDLVKQQFTLNRDVLSVSRCHRSPVEGGGGYSMRAEIMPVNQQIAVIANPGDEDFIKTTGLQLIAGTGYSAKDVKLASDTDSKKRIYSFVLNETAAKQLGWSPQEAIGKKMFLGDNRPGYVKGVVRDFNFQSLHDPIKGYILFPEAWSRELLLKLSGKNLPQTISFLESKWKTIVPDRPFEYRFMDDDYNKLYDSEMRLGKVMTLFSTIAIILACLGLFGLSSFTAQQRFKEIGIRKVLGASIGDIVVALSMGFIRLTCLAIVIAFPLAWWLMTKWLQDFTYKTDMTWSVYLAAALLTLFLAIATTAIHAVRAAFTNPVESLRRE
jgi:putative ABC transport system permease protein